ncbi:MAG: hypothetical protein AW09_003915 [Candidatus Accumulibacter phosphatis]|uniref:Uncharacterized protein n=1 Tax=Candidatus Accumulibacter phosphatis TaxID=327160 RepID=A0A080LRU8_9PROT|nr:MAG: hypothetical protein AW09_003915 [Candidatus Accumulibacter phosphatis]
MQQCIEQGVDTGEHREWILAHLRHETRNITGIGNQQVAGTNLEKSEAIRRQRKDMVERQRSDHHVLLVTQRRLDPGVRLRQIRQDVAMNQHGPFREAGRSTRILQKSQVFLCDGHRFQLRCSTLGERSLEIDCAWQTPSRNHLLDVLDDKVDDSAFRKTEHVAKTSHHDVLEWRPGQHLLQRERKIFDNHDDLGSRILELMFKFSRRVQRVDVHHHVTRTQGTEDTNRILE